MMLLKVADCYVHIYIYIQTYTCKKNVQKYANFVIHIQNIQNMRPYFANDLETSIYMIGDQL